MCLPERVHSHLSVCACTRVRAVSLATRPVFQFWFQFSFPFFFFFYFLKIISPFRNKFTRKPAPLPPRWTGRSHLVLNRADLPSQPQTGAPQEASEGWSLSLVGGTPWWQ